LNVRPRHKQCFGAGAPDREHLNLGVRRVETCLQVENDLSALDPEQMAPGTLGAAFDKPDGEDVDMSRRDLKRVAAVVEQLRMAAIEYDVARRTDVRCLIGRRLGLLEKGFTHS
jgi:hypothetical protein